MKRIVLFILIWLALVTTAQSASFDCRQASSSLEKTICTDSEISLLDETLAKSYDNALKVLSSDGNIILRDGQRRWLHFINDVCFNYKNNRGGSTCVNELYKRRIKDMETEAIQIGPFLFSRIDYFFSKSDDEFGRPYQGQTSYPRIDSPLSENVKIWNAKMAKKSEAEGDDWCDGRPGDIGIGFVIKSATESIISAQLGNWMYCHGANHGYGGSHTITFVLTPQFHLLQSYDLFASDKEWAEFLANRSFNVLDKAVDIGRSSSDPQIDRDAMREQILAIVSDTGSWSFTKDSLVITFCAGTVIGFGSAGGDQTVTIPWDDLKPYLVPNNPIVQTGIHEDMPKSDIEIADSKYSNKDYSGAIILYKKLAEAGNSLVALKLGDMYYRGIGTAPEHASAFYWYKKAAENGNKIAQKHIAAMYEMGDGTKVNKGEADIWQKKADQINR